MVKETPDKIESSLFSRYYAEVCNEIHLPAKRLGNTAPKKRRSDDKSWRQCVRFDLPRNRMLNSRTDSVSA